MKKLFSTFLLIGLLFPTITEAGFSPEGVNRPKKSRCKSSGGVIGCRILKKPKKCSKKRPCIPRGYYRKDPIKYIPMK
tara:strand:+ start:259 stop:492 length:234 start_codon:yes stop_codon:yes gene_type:complete